MKSEGLIFCQHLCKTCPNDLNFVGFIFYEKIRTPYWKSRHPEKLSKLLKIGPKVSVPSFECAKVSQVQELPLSTHLG